MSDEKLRPCPFCGSPLAKHGADDGNRFIYCGGCRAEGPNIPHGRLEDDEARDEAARLWNRRAP